MLDKAAAHHAGLADDSVGAIRLGNTNQGPAATAVRTHFTGGQGALPRADDLAHRLHTTADGLRTGKSYLEWIIGLLAATAAAAAVAVAYFPELLPRLAGTAKRFFGMIEDAMRSLGRIFTRLGERSTSKRVDVVAGRLHEQWRAPRRLEDGTFEPRIKSTTDSAWISRHGTDQVDIANTRYGDLPADWQKENKESARVAVHLVTDAKKEGVDTGSSDFMESASAKVHDAWLERNGEWAPPEQKLPYEELSEAEKEKDRVVVRKALDI
ncbi:hypothetical protein NE235_29805 [Actinoallomurus spadix]|uniref:hypothetical protein n=1 Tax=Actinoallomurus spadix TaxID=79912 RepID=UPI0020928DDD|nr:hypothetical protein [Actinoallomurus spadix]MCO5990316.1 hypothetical protein [Actinoallomurus spadix]